MNIRYEGRGLTGMRRRLDRCTNSSLQELLGWEYFLQGITAIEVELLKARPFRKEAIVIRVYHHIFRHVDSFPRDEYGLSYRQFVYDRAKGQEMADRLLVIAREQGLKEVRNA